MPLSIIGTFGVMWLLGYSIDNLSLMALTISTGFVVDDAIVVTENITRAIESGDSPFDAALKGAEQIGFTIVSITVSLLAVFVPILLMGGIVGRLFREFAVTLSVAIAMSALVSLTLTPMMCSRLLRSEAHAAHGRAVSRLGALLRCDRSPSTSAVSAGRCSIESRCCSSRCSRSRSTWRSSSFVPKGLFPQQDTGLLTATTEASQDISSAEMLRLQTQVNRVFSDDPTSSTTYRSSGSGGFGTQQHRFGVSFAQAKPPRKLSADEVLGRLRGQAREDPGDQRRTCRRGRT